MASFEGGGSRHHLYLITSFTSYPPPLSCVDHHPPPLSDQFFARSPAHVGVWPPTQEPQTSRQENQSDASNTSNSSNTSNTEILTLCCQYWNTKTEIPILNYQYWNTNSEIPILNYQYWNTNTEIPILNYQYWNTNASNTAMSTLSCLRKWGMVSLTSCMSCVKLHWVFRWKVKQVFVERSNKF